MEEDQDVSTTPSPQQQLHELRDALWAIVQALGAALPMTPEVRTTVGKLLDTVPPCKHCGEPLTRQANGNHTHAAGLQAGKGRCALSPYGFMAEPIGTPCSDHPANPCNGSRGIEPKP